MHKDLNENEWEDALITKDGQVVIGEDPFPCDLTQLVKGSSLDENGYVVDPKNKKKYDFHGRAV